MPTMDRPFGIQIWPIFNNAFQQIVGFPADDFRFIPFETSLSTFKAASISIVMYYLVILGGQSIMRKRTPFKLENLFLFHNLCLTAISGILLILFVEQIIPILARDGIFHAICHHEGGWTQRLVVLYYVSVSA